MCLAVVLVVECKWWGGGSALAAVNEVAMLTAEEFDNGWGRQRLCSKYFL
jgi:hypothetical protein